MNMSEVDPLHIANVGCAGCPESRPMSILSKIFGEFSTALFRKYRAEIIRWCDFGKNSERKHQLKSFEINSLHISNVGCNGPQASLTFHQEFWRIFICFAVSYRR